MDIKKDKLPVSPVITEHWKIKFEKSIRILLKSGYKIDDLIEKIKSIEIEEKEKIK